MNESQIKTIITGYLLDAQANMNKENPKLDFKAKWYDLKDDGEINEFIKDTSAIANTPGLDGFIVIGYDERNKCFIDADFSQSKLKDSNEMVGLIMKRVDRAYNVACLDLQIEEHKLSVIHIPPSFDKPHVIKNYHKSGKQPIEHRVFIRNGSTTRVATKYDLDFMAYDRKNHSPEYAVYISTAISSISPNHNNSQNISLSIGLVVENSGVRPIAIKELTLTFYYLDRTFTYVSSTNKEERYNTHISVSNLVVQPFEIKNFTGLTFISKEKVTNSEFLEFMKVYTRFEAVQATLTLNNRRILETTLEF